MQSPASKNPRSLSLGALALAGALTSLALSACDKSESPSAPVNPNALITLIKPMGGETFKVGDSLRVRWSTKTDVEDPTTSVDVRFSPDSGATWFFVPWGPNQLTGSLGKDSYYWKNFAWKITDSLYSQDVLKKVKISGSNKCLIQVRDYLKNSDLNRTDVTHSFITITP